MNDDSSLRELFHTRFAPDENRAPDFSTVWSAAAARHHRRRIRTLAAGIGALAAAAAFAFLSPHTFPPAKTPPRATAELPWRTAVLLTEWRAPTDALLPALPLSLQP